MQSFPLRSSQQGDSPPSGEGQGSPLADGLIGTTSSMLAKIESKTLQNNEEGGQ